MNSNSQDTSNNESIIMEISESLSWLYNLSDPIAHNREKEDFIKHHAYNDMIGSAEFVLEVDQANGIIVKEDRLAPNFERSVFKINFDDHTYVKAIHINLLLHDLLLCSRSDSMTLMHFKSWLRKTELAGKSAANVAYFDQFQKYLQALRMIYKKLNLGIKFLAEKDNKMDWSAPHKKDIYALYEDYRQIQELSVKDSYEALESHMIKRGLNPRDYSLHGSPQNFNRAFNKWKTRQIRNHSSSI